MAEDTRNLNIEPEEIEAGKTMAFVAYLVFFIPFLMEDMRKNKFVMFHTEQSIILLILNLIAGILGVITCGIGMILYVPYLIFLIMGIMNALGGKVVPLPLIGQFGEKLNLVNVDKLKFLTKQLSRLGGLLFYLTNRTNLRK